MWMIVTPFALWLLWMYIRHHEYAIKENGKIAYRKNHK